MPVIVFDVLGCKCELRIDVIVMTIIIILILPIVSLLYSKSDQQNANYHRHTRSAIKRDQRSYTTANPALKSIILIENTQIEIHLVYFVDFLLKKNNGVFE